jgi:hypothetical protein
VYRSPILSEVGFLRLCACNPLNGENKEEELVDVAPWCG